MTAVTLALFAILALVYGDYNDNVDSPDTAFHGFSTVEQHRWLEDNNDNNNDNGNDDSTTDYSSYSCHDLYQTVPTAGTAQCNFARTCNAGEGIWASFVFCSSWFSRSFLIAVVSPFVVLWLVLLFRMLGSTAEDYFSPALEMFAVKLQLPPRFAGVSLLALGNGAADVSATVSAIKNDPDHGYKLALGALTGAAMVIGAVVSALVVLVAEGLPCRGALVRDVAALGLAVLVVWHQLASGVVTAETVTLFLALYVVFVLLVLAADVYHRTVVLPRRQALQAERERQRQLQAESLHQQATTAGGSHSDTVVVDAPPESKFSHVLTAFSNYDNPPTLSPHTASSTTHAFGNAVDGMGVDSDLLAADTPIMLHGAHGILNARRHGLSSPARVPTSEQDDDDVAAAAAYDRFEDEPDGGIMMMGGNGGNDGGGGFCVDPNIIGSQVSLSISEAWEEGVHEVKRHVEALWDDVVHNGDLDMVTKYLLVLEFPVTILRQATVPLPCEGYYNRGVTALSLALSPLWMAFYLHRGHEVSIWKDSSWFFIYWVLILIAAVAVLRLAPATPVEPATSSIMPNLWVATPVALYGFCIAATWIDTVADELVGVLDFVGIVLKIPGPIVGLTILAWGNSMSDLSADLTMARKGLANMAMTACFAGPLFNILVGLGMGFSSLAAQSGQASRAVSVSPSAATGFLFIALNSLVILITGLGMGKGTIPKKYGYIALTLYSIYLITSIVLQYSPKYKDT